jgi:CubicO group peptidase (beta-lactamase class C family)
MIRHRNIVYGLIIISLVIASSCTVKPAQVAQTPYWPADDWRTSTPEEQGLDSALILQMLQEIRSKDLNIHSILIIRHGYLVSEVYFPPYQQNIKHPIFSITKSVTSAMAGKAIHDGYINDVHQKVLVFFPDIAEDTTDPRRAEITLEHLLTMSAGYNTGTMPNLYGKDASFDTVRHILTYNSVLVSPGTTFFYDSGLPHLLSAVLQNSSGMTLQEYTEQELFHPMGITDLTWGSDPRGITTGATDLRLLPRDMAKFGYLFLHQGEWNEQQLLPKEWVEISTTKHIETKGLMNAAEDDGYGYLWWIDSFGGYSAHGYGGQYIFVLPSLDMVIVFTGGLADAQFPVPNQLVQTYLIPAAQATKPLPPNPQTAQSLAKLIQTIEGREKVSAPLPKIAQEISGKTFLITKEEIWVPYDAITLTFSGEEIYTNETQLQGNHIFILTGNLNQSFHLNQVTFPGPPPQDLLLPLRGYWQNDIFIEEYMQNLITDIDLITQKYIFAGDQVTIEVSSSMGVFSGQVKGEVLE